MRRWQRILLTVLVVLVVALGAAYYWFVYDTGRPGDLQPFRLDLAQARILSAASEGERPTAIHVENVADVSFPETAVIAGTGWGGFPMGMYSYQLVYPHQTIVLDTGIDPEAAGGFGGTYDTEAWHRVLTGMGQASQILLTHEHPDHIAGVLSHPDPTAITPKLSLSVEQLASAGRYGGFTVAPPVLNEAQPVAYEDMIAIAPGVVLIKAPGHSPGSQMVFVTLQDGTEFLFTGDIGWSFRNIETGVGRPRLLSQFMLNEDRNAVFAELDALKALHQAEPDIVLIPGHDRSVVDALLVDGRMSAQFAQ